MIKKLYDTLNIEPTEKALCNTLDGKCISKVKDCNSCGVSIKTKSYRLSEKQQLELIKLYLNSSLSHVLNLLCCKHNYEESIAEMILATWEHLPENMKNSIKNILAIKELEKS